MQVITGVTSKIWAKACLLSQLFSLKLWSQRSTLHLRKCLDATILDVFAGCPLLSNSSYLCCPFWSSVVPCTDWAVGSVSQGDVWGCERAAGPTNHNDSNRYGSVAFSGLRYRLVGYERFVAGSVWKKPKLELVVLGQYTWDISDHHATNSLLHQPRTSIPDVSVQGISRNMLACTDARYPCLRVGCWKCQELADHIVYSSVSASEVRGCVIKDVGFWKGTMISWRWELPKVKRMDGWNLEGT